MMVLTGGKKYAIIYVRSKREGYQTQEASISLKQWQDSVTESGECTGHVRDIVRDSKKNKRCQIDTQ